MALDLTQWNCMHYGDMHKRNIIYHFGFAALNSHSFCCCCCLSILLHSLLPPPLFYLLIPLLFRLLLLLLLPSLLSILAFFFLFFFLILSLSRVSFFSVSLYNSSCFSVCCCCVHLFLTSAISDLVCRLVYIK